MSDDSIRVTHGSEEDFRMAVDVMHKNVKWLIGYGDYAAYTKACGDGYRFIVAKTLEGDFVGCAVLARLQDDLAFIDAFFVHPKYRGSGKGRILFETVFPDDIRKTCNVGLHAEVALSEYYDKKQGFSKFNEVTLEIIHLTNFTKSCRQLDHSFRIVEDVKKTADDIFKIDEIVWKKSRKSFLDTWIQRSDVRTLAVYSEDKIVGYGVIRQACLSRGYLLGPVYVTKEEAFMPLLEALLGPLDESTIMEIRSPSVSSERLHRLLKDRGTLRQQGRYITQFTKQVPDYNYDPVYSLTDTTTPV